MLITRRNIIFVLSQSETLAAHGLLYVHVIFFHLKLDLERKINFFGKHTVVD